MDNKKIIDGLLKKKSAALPSPVSDAVEVEVEDTDVDDVSMDSTEAVAQEVIDAIEAKDSAALVSAIKSLVFMLSLIHI